MSDEAYQALITMIEMTNNSSQRNALHAALDMLCDFYYHKWLTSSDEENKAFVKSYMVSNFVI